MSTMLSSKNPNHKIKIVDLMDNTVNYEMDDQEYYLTNEQAKQIQGGWIPPRIRISLTGYLGEDYSITIITIPPNY